MKKDIIIGIIIGILIILSIIKIISNKKKGKHNCMFSCSNCSYSNSCKKKKDEE